MKPPYACAFLVAASLVSAAACDRPTEEPGTSEAPAAARLPPQPLSEAEIQAGWRLLFDGKTTSGWRGVYEAGFPADRWVVEDGMLKIVGEEPGPRSIITEEQFSSFELSLEFKSCSRTKAAIASGSATSKSGNSEL